MKWNRLFIWIYYGSVSAVAAMAATQGPLFDVERGFYETPFTVTLNASDPDAKIYYTTDGTRPTDGSTLYTEPISITTTTPLSAVEINGSISGPVVTNTYLFIKDIVLQPAQPEGYPDRWGPLNYAVGNYAAGENAPADYEMDPEICNHTAYKDLISDAFLAIPSVCIVTNPGHIFSHSTDPDTGGIYIYTGDTGNPSSNGGGKLGSEWERPASIEFYEPGTGEQFQINCGLRLHGGNSRKPYNSGKHSFRVSFRKEYGEGKLKFNVFKDETATDRFDHLVFRAGYNYSWVKNNDTERLNAQYIYDSFAKKTQLRMGNLAAHDRFVHLFINGLYWGIYDVSEKLNDNFLEAYWGGTDTDYDVINDDGVVDGNATAYNEMISLAKNGKYDDLLSKNLLYMENFIDYLLVNFYIGNMDWGKNNWFAGRNRITPDQGFHFFSWDAENCMTDVNLDRISGNNAFEGPLREILFGSSSGSVNGGLSKNAEFKRIFSERVQQHFFNGGALSPESVAECYRSLADEIDLPVILESARWGDFRKKVMPHNNTKITYTRNEHWLPRRQALFDDYLPKRTEIVLAQLKKLGLYTPPATGVSHPQTDSPIYFADNKLYYTLPTDGTVSIELFTSDGRRILNKVYPNRPSGVYTEPLTGMKNGIYIYKIQRNNIINRGKLIQ
jgi:hypothetical protein